MDCEYWHALPKFLTRLSPSLIYKKSYLSQIKYSGVKYNLYEESFPEKKLSGWHSSLNREKNGQISNFDGEFLTVFWSTDFLSFPIDDFHTLNNQNLG